MYKYESVKEEYMTKWEITETENKKALHKIRATEKNIKMKFMREHLPIFADMIKADAKKLRLYAFELPVRTESDGTKYADVVLEIDDGGIPQENKMFVLEFKRKKVDSQSAVAQVLRYSDVIKKQLYRKKRVTPFVVATGYSEAELKLAKEQKVIPVRYDHKTGKMEIKT